MVHKAEDTIYQRHYISKDRLTSLMNMKDGVGQNPTKDLVVHEGSDMSNDTQSEDQRMQGDQIIETTN